MAFSFLVARGWPARFRWFAALAVTAIVTGTLLVTPVPADAGAGVDRPDRRRVRSVVTIEPPAKPSRKAAEQQSYEVPIGSAAKRSEATRPLTFSECDATPAADQVGGWLRDRFSFCERLQARIDVFETPSQRLIGTIRFRSTQLGLADDVSRRFRAEFRVDDFRIGVVSSDPIENARDFALLYTTELELALRCASPDGAGHCRHVGAAQVVRPVWAWQLESEFASFEVRSDRAGQGPDLIASSRLGQEWRARPPFNPAGAWAVAASHQLRWDSAPYLPGDGGAVLTGLRPYLSLRLDDPAVTDVAGHIYGAFYQPDRTYPLWSDKGVPGNNDAVARIPLTRTVDSALQAHNARAADVVCRGIDPAYPSRGYACDAFPFRTTSQGAGMQSDPARPRFSACPLAAAHSDTAARQMDQWYANDRVLDTVDPFYVRVVGTPPPARTGCFTYSPPTVPAPSR